MGTLVPFAPSALGLFGIKKAAAALTPTPSAISTSVTEPTVTKTEETNQRAAEETTKAVVQSEKRGGKTLLTGNAGASGTVETLTPTLTAKPKNSLLGGSV